MGMMDVMAGRVAAGQTVEFRPRGSSMVPLIRSGQRVTVAPADPERVGPGDIVLTKVSGTVYLHLVSAVDRARRRMRISNNRGRVNGWTGYERVFGICVAVEDVARPGAGSKVRVESCG
ncbi:S26 family signal peptidase [Streptomyces tritici]|uniref:S26 family signal peptidase n=1 Tax=Streptomyces tritici TaxID=2054410 RepID=UPI003AEFDD45